MTKLFYYIFVPLFYSMNSLPLQNSFSSMIKVQGYREEKRVLGNIPARASLAFEALL